MHLDDLIITAFCLIDDMLKEILANRRLRQRGPMPLLADSEVLTMEVVGEYLELNKDKAIYDYFRRHYSHLFPAMAKVHRTTFTRQAANLREVKRHIWQRLLQDIPKDEGVHIVDSMPIAVCEFPRANRHKLFREWATYGYNSAERRRFYGFRLHTLVALPGVIVGFVLAPAHIQDTEVVESLVNGQQGLGLLLGDRNYWSPRLREELEKQGVWLHAAFKKKSSGRDEEVGWTSLCSRVRYRIETLFSQLDDRYSVKSVGARDLWHLGNRLIRKVLSHTLAVMLNQSLGNPPFQISKLLT